MVFQFTTSQGGRRRSDGRTWRNVPFNSRPHKEVDVHTVRNAGRKLTFQFTTSQGGRPESYSYPVFQGFFQFTTSQGGRPGSSGAWYPQLSIFQFTTSQGGRPLIPHCFFSMDSFNSRPHKEVDWQEAAPDTSGDIFQFTTSQGGRLRRSCILAFRTVFQFTTSQGGRPNPNSDCRQGYSFNSRPHKEVDLFSVRH